MSTAYARSSVLFALISVLVACAPVLDWREVRPAGTELLAMFPCRPKVHVRQLNLAGASVRMHLTECSAQATTYALAYASLDGPDKVTAALDELRRAAAANIGAASPLRTASQVPGMTPNALAERLRLEGRGAEGTPVQEEVVFFVKAARVYQATVFGGRIDPEATETFFAGLKLGT